MPDTASIRGHMVIVCQLIVFLALGSISNSDAQASQDAMNSESAQTHGFTIQIGPQQDLGLGIDLGQAVLLFGGQFNFNWYTEERQQFSVIPQLGIKLFVTRQKTVAPYLHGWLSKDVLLKNDFDSGSPLRLGGGLGLEYPLSQNLNVAGEVGLQLYRRSDEDGWRHTAAFTQHSIALRYTF